MGQMVLDDFRRRLGFVVRSENLENDLLDLWINAAYFEVVGANSFDRFKEDVEFTFDAGENAILVAEGTLAVLSLFHFDNEREILYTAPENFRRYVEDSGDPERWTQIGNELFVWKTPEDDLTLSGIVLNEPDRLLLPEDKTVLETTWDEVIFLLSAEKAFLDLDNAERAAGYAQRAIAMMQSRAPEGDRTMRRQSEGLNVARTENDLRLMRRY